MDAKTLAASLEDILDDLQPEEWLQGMVERTRSFDQAGVLTSDEGLVVDMGDGSQFQITVVMSRPQKGA
jgi:hypothetical protein